MGRGSIKLYMHVIYTQIYSIGTMRIPVFIGINLWNLMKLKVTLLYNIINSFLKIDFSKFIKL